MTSTVLSTITNLAITVMHGIAVATLIAQNILVIDRISPIYNVVPNSPDINSNGIKPVSISNSVLLDDDYSLGFGPNDGSTTASNASNAEKGSSAGSISGHVSEPPPSKHAGGL